MAHFSVILQLHHHPLLTNIARPFFSQLLKKTNCQFPKSCYLILKCRPLHEVVFNFCDAGATLRNATASADFFYVPALHGKVRIMQYKKKLDHQTRFNTTNLTSLLRQF